MVNNNALSQANAAAQQAKQAYGMLLVGDGAVRRNDGSGGFGLQYLAQSVESLARAVAFLAQQQP